MASIASMRGKRVEGVSSEREREKGEGWGVGDVQVSVPQI